MLTIQIAFIIYSLVVLTLGWLAYQRKDRADEYWTAGRNLNAVSVGLSISAGFMSISWSCVYAVQLFYWYGIGALWLVTIPWIMALWGIYHLAKKYHSLPSFSQPEMVGQKFGKGSKQIVAFALVFVFLVWGGAEIYVAAELLAPGLGFSIRSVIFIISTIVMIYSVLGGFRAVVMTDKLQYAIVAIYVITMGWLASKGLSEIGGSLPDQSIMGAKSSSSWTNLFAPGVGIIFLTLSAYLPGWIFETDLWLRVQSAKDEKTARRGVVIAGINGLIFVGVLPMFIGISALKIFPMVNSKFPDIIGFEGSGIFTALVTSYAPEWLMVIIAIGLVAAAMSTIDTCVNVMALSIAYDLGETNHKPNAEKWSRLSIVCSVIISTLFALNINSLWDIFYLSSGILTTTVAFPVAAIFIQKVNSKGVVWSARFGFIGTIIFYFFETRGSLNILEPEWLLNSQLGFIFWGILSAILGYFVGSTIIKRK